MPQMTSEIAQKVGDRLQALNGSYHPAIRHKPAFELRFGAKRAALNPVRLTAAGFARLRAALISVDCFVAAKPLRNIVRQVP